MSDAPFDELFRRLLAEEGQQDAPRQGARVTTGEVRVERGGELSADQARALEEQLAWRPSDLGKRLLLVEHYWPLGSHPSATDWARHMGWLIENAPGAVDSESPCFFLSLTPFDVELSALWMAAAERHADDVAVLKNTAISLHHGGRDDRARIFCTRALDLRSDDASLYRLLGVVEQSMARRAASGAERIEIARAALAAYRQALDLLRPRGLVVAFAALRTAVLAEAWPEIPTLVRLMIDTVPSEPTAETFASFAKYEGAIALGHVAVACALQEEGGISKAEEHLLAAASALRALPRRTVADLELGLAEALLQRGRRDAVRAYLEACVASGPPEHVLRRLRAWCHEIEHGQTPTLALR